MDAIKSDSLDLIACKIDEYANFPGLILGLDGWILRSLPIEFRAKFLTGYEKLLQVVFHPDRYQDAAKKKSRDAFLRSLSEAVAFMLLGPVEYDLGASDVPTRKNPLVQLHNTVDRQDEIIARLHAEKIIPENLLYQERKEWVKTREGLTRRCEFFENRFHAQCSLHRVAKRIYESDAVPTHWSHSEIVGKWIEFSKTRELKRLILSRMNWPLMDVDCDLQQVMQSCQAAQITIVFTSGQAKQGPRNTRIVCAMSVAHMIEFCKLELCNDEINENTVDKAFGFLSHEITESEDNKLCEKLKTHSLPFYCRNMFLIVRWHEGGQIKHSLLFVEDASAVTDRFQAIETGIKKQLVREKVKTKQEKQRYSVKLDRLQARKEKFQSLTIKKRAIMKAALEKTRQLRERNKQLRDMIILLKACQGESVT